MRQVIVGGVDNQMDNAATEYNFLCGGDLWTPAPTTNCQVISTPGTLDTLRIYLNGAAPGAGASWTFTLELDNGGGWAATALTVTLSDAETADVDAVNNVAVAAGDLIRLRCVPSVGPAPALTSSCWSIMFEGTNNGESLILGGTRRALNVGATEYGHVQTAFFDWSNVENTARQVIPTDGTIRNFYVWLDHDPGNPADAFRFTLRVNGANSTLTVTITDPDTTGNDVVNNVAVNAGDYVTLMVEPINGPAWASVPAWGMTFAPDIDGESIIMNGITDDLHQVNTEYVVPNATNIDTWTGVEASHYQLVSECEARNFYMLLENAPGGVASRTFNFRANAAATGITVTITGAATTGNDTVNTAALNDGDLIALQSVPAGNPAVGDCYWGLALYIQPPSAAFGDVVQKMAVNNII